MIQNHMFFETCLSKIYVSQSIAHCKSDSQVVKNQESQESTHCQHVNDQQCQRKAK